MAKVDVVDIKGKKIKQMELPASIFEAPVNNDLMHQAFVRQNANARLGTHDTKVRGEVSGGGRKPWRQKGTGRSRAGSIRAAQWVGGGKIHTPHPRSYEQKMPRKMRRAAVRSALTVRAREDAIILVDDFSVKEAKTKELRKLYPLTTNTLPAHPERLPKISAKSAYHPNAGVLTVYADIISKSH